MITDTGTNFDRSGFCAVVDTITKNIRTELLLRIVPLIPTESSAGYKAI